MPLGLAGLLAVAPRPQHLILLALLAPGCTLIVDNKLHQTTGSGDGSLPADKVSPVPTKPTGEQTDPQAPFLISERIRMPMDGQGQATQALIGPDPLFGIPCPGGPQNKVFACNIAPFTTSGAANTKLFLVDTALKPLASWDIRIRRLLVGASPGQPELRLYDADTIQAVGRINLGGPLKSVPPVLSPSGRFLAVVTGNGPMLVDLVRRVRVPLPQACAELPPAFQPDAQILATKISPDSPLPYPRPESQLWCGRGKLSIVSLPERIEAQTLTAVDGPAGGPFRHYSFLLHPDGTRWLVGLNDALHPFVLQFAPGSSAAVLFSSEVIPGAIQVVGLLDEKSGIGLAPQGAAIVLSQEGGTYRVSALRPAPGQKLAQVSEKIISPAARMNPIEAVVPVPFTNLVGFSGTVVSAANIMLAQLKNTASVDYELSLELATELTLPPGVFRAQPVPVLASLLYTKRVLLQQGSVIWIFQDSPNKVIVNAKQVGEPPDPPIAHHPMLQRLYSALPNKIVYYEYTAVSFKATEMSSDGLPLPAYLMVQP